MPSNHLIICRSLLLPPSIFPSIRVFSSESVLHIRWPEYWSFSFSISPFNEYSGLISFRMDWVDLLAVQGTLKSLLQHHSSKASILQHSVFFIVQLSHLYMITGKTIALTRQTPAAPRRQSRKWSVLRSTSRRFHRCVNTWVESDPMGRHQKGGSGERHSRRGTSMGQGQRLELLACAGSCG